MPRFKSKGKERKNTRQQYEDDEIEGMMRSSEQKEDEQKANLVKQISINKDIKYKNAKQKDLVKMIHEKQITIIQGPAGTGKTFMALKAALEILKLAPNGINKMVLTKPIVEAGESVGFLPGDIKEKTDPYIKSFLENLHELIGKNSTRNLLDSGVIESAPLSYIRGNTFRRSISILDEAQNTTKTAMKLFVSRIGEGSKMIILGDSDQSDLFMRNGEPHGLADVYKRLKGVEGIGFFEFDEDDIVRSAILIDIMKKYKN